MIWLWIGFIAFIFVMLALDLGVFHRKSHVVSAREALIWTSVWVCLSLVFCGVVYLIYSNHLLGAGNAPGNQLNGTEAAIKYITGYIVEFSLSMDNVFVIALIFQYFQIPREYQHRTLFWGILGAIVLRMLMILLGIGLIEQFHWIIYVFGAFLVFTAYKMIGAGEETPSPDKNILVRIARRFYPVSHHLDGEKFFTKIDGKTAMTPLFLVLLMVESTDVIFAIDSIPAILGVTTESFLVFTSNLFAILGLRSLYFGLSAMIDKFHYLKASLVVVLAYVGIKMLLSDFIHLDPLVSLGIIVGILIVGVVASLIRSSQKKHQADLSSESESGENI